MPVPVRMISGRRFNMLQGLSSQSSAAYDALEKARMLIGELEGMIRKASADRSIGDDDRANIAQLQTPVHDIFLAVAKAASTLRVVDRKL